MSRSPLPAYCLPVLALAAAACAHAPAAPPRSLREPHSGLTNPLLDCEVSDFSEMRPFASKARRLIAQEKEAGDISRMALYFRDLDDGLDLEFGEDQLFIAASLLKVPILIAYLKRAESDPGALSRSMVFQQTHGARLQSTAVADPLVDGRSYTTLQLLEHMIAESDNQAARALLRGLSAPEFEKVFADLGLPAPDIAGADYPVNVNDYSRFFRILFNASYLNRENSELALRLLAETRFRDGLVAGSPPGLTVAHKFGERRLPDGEVQLHDCGIVYYPGDPYLLCVMTSGWDLGRQAKAIARLSALVAGQARRQFRGR